MLGMQKFASSNRKYDLLSERQCAYNYLHSDMHKQSCNNTSTENSHTYKYMMHYAGAAPFLFGFDRAQYKETLEHHGSRTIIQLKVKVLLQRTTPFGADIDECAPKDKRSCLCAHLICRVLYVCRN